MRGLVGILAMVLVAFASTCVFPDAALAQQIKPLEIEPDENGVDLLTGRVEPKLPTLSVPGAGNLTYTSISKLLPFMTGATTAGPESSYRVNRGGTSASLTCLDGECVASNKNGSSLTADLNLRQFTFIQGGSARKIFFDRQYSWSDASGGGWNFSFYPSWIEYANGEKHTFTYETYPVGSIVRHRPSRVVSNLGYELRVSYQSNTQETAGWRTPSVVAIYKSSDPNTPLAQHTFSGTMITDLAGRTTTCGGCDFSMDAVPMVNATSLTLPGEGSASYSATASSAGTTYAKPVGQVVRDGTTWTFSYQNLTHVYQDIFTPKFTAITVSGPLGFTRSANIWHPADLQVSNYAPRVTSITKRAEPDHRPYL